jgi:hypothetical protein
MTQAPEPNLAGPTRERGAATHGVARLDAATAEARRRAPFRNGVEAGFPESLIRAMSEALDNHGDDPKLRFITFARTPHARLNASESRLSVTCVRAGREHAAQLGVWCVYVPRTQRHARRVIDVAGIHWLHAAGYASRSIMDVYGLSATRLFALLRGQPRPNGRVRQIRDATSHAEAHAAGLAWLERHGRLPEALTPPDRARVARCGHALLAFREHFGREPRRGDLGPSDAGAAAVPG